MFKVYPPIFGLGLKALSESEPDVRVSAFGAEGLKKKKKKKIKNHNKKELALIKTNI